MTALIPTGSGYYNPSQTYGNYTSTSAVRTDMTYSQAQDIVIHTLEGDTVTLSAASYNTAGYETYESLAVGRDGYAYRYGEKAYFESHQQMNIAVTGDLNREELEDINNILGTLNEMMKDLTAGNLGHALSRSSEFTGIDTIASFSADLNITATLSTSRLESVIATSPAPGTWDEDDTIMARIDQMADNISNALKTHTTLFEYLEPEINNSLSDWLDKTYSESEDPAKGKKWARRFAEHLMDALKPSLLHDEERRNHFASGLNDTSA